jgi:mono/diheme cytochrome c family protein
MRLGVIASLAAAGGASLALLPPRASTAVPPEAVEAGYVGAARCGECHQAMTAKWSSGRHSRMLQPASPASVVGDFSSRRLSLRGRRYALRSDGQAFFVTESDLDGRERERRIDYTLGSRRIQHYLTTLEDGRIAVLAPSWDVGRKQWFHNMEIVDPEETADTRVQVWNANCVGCHVSQEQKGYEPATHRYRTRWMDFGTSCEVCHGPGRDHSESESSARAVSVVHPERLGAERSTMVCAQCHSLRDVTAPGFRAGEDYFDHFMPILEYAQKADKDPAYWPDGRPRRFSNDALGFWQSRCFLRGRELRDLPPRPHVPDVDRNPSSLLPTTNCASAATGDRCLGGAHTHHRAGGRAPCVECHMPRTVVSIKAGSRDHTLSVPAPETRCASASRTRAPLSRGQERGVR